jgi:hypothetical protein
MNFLKKKNRSGDKIYFHYDFGRAKGQRPSTGVFIYSKPRDQVQKNHNKEALTLLEIKKSQLTLERQGCRHRLYSITQDQIEFFRLLQRICKKQ